MTPLPEVSGAAGILSVEKDRGSAVALSSFPPTPIVGWSLLAHTKLTPSSVLLVSALPLWRG